MNNETEIKNMVDRIGAILKLKHGKANQLAKYLGEPQSQVSRIFKSNRLPRVETILKLQNWYVQEGLKKEFTEKQIEEKMAEIAAIKKIKLKLNPKKT